MITNDTKKIEGLLRELVCAFVDHPDRIQLAHQAAEDGTVYWALKGHPDDDPKLIGKGGSHIDALGLLVEKIGAAAGTIFTFRLITTPGPWAKKPPAEPRHVVDHNPQPSLLLLRELLAALGFGDAVASVGPGEGVRRTLTFVFMIRVAGMKSYDELTKEHRLDPDSARSQNLVGAIGTLYRAIAKKAGVRFSIVAVDPRSTN